MLQMTRRYDETRQDVSGKSKKQKSMRVDGCGQ